MRDPGLPTGALKVRLQRFPLCRLEELLGLLSREHLHFLLWDPWRIDRIAYVARYQLPAQRIMEGAVKDTMDMLDCLRRIALFQFLVVQFLQVLWRHLLQLNLS
jgi:hypothetical protein